MSPPTPPDDPLDALLERWRDAVPPAPDALAADVRRRLTAPSRPARRGWLALLVEWGAAVEALFARGSFTAAVVAASVLLGLFLAEARVSRLHEQRNRQFVRNYIRHIDPLAEGAPGESAAAPAAQPTEAAP